MTFDRQISFRRLKPAGVDERIARAHGDALQTALSETAAPKVGLRKGLAAPVRD